LRDGTAFFRYGVQVNSLGLTEEQPENNAWRILITYLVQDALTASRDDDPCSFNAHQRRMIAASRKKTDQRDAYWIEGCRCDNPQALSERRKSDSRSAPPRARGNWRHCSLLLPIRASG